MRWSSAPRVLPSRSPPSGRIDRTHNIEPLFIDGPQQRQFHTNRQIPEWTLRIYPQRSVDYKPYSRSFTANFAGRNALRFISMKAIALLFAGAVCWAVAPGPSPDPAYILLTSAYEQLHELHYDRAIAFFLNSIEAAPARASIRKDLAYVYLKIGETEAARDHFGEAMRLDPPDVHVALEYAFLCFETKKQAEARRIFDRIRKTGDPASRATAEQAFQNIDAPLKAGIAQWSAAAAASPENFSAHYDLATFAEQRDELDLAAEHFLKAWRILPQRKSILLDIGRVSKAAGKLEQANAALLAASRGGEPRTAEAARELLPSRYPYVYEFRRALELDPANVELHRELAYLLLRMEQKPEAEREFKKITETSRDDLLSFAQLGLLYLSRNENAQAMPLLDRVLVGSDPELASRVRAAVHIAPELLKRDAAAASTPLAPEDPRLMADRSIKAGFLKDALKYLELAHESDPADTSIMLKMGWTDNLLHNDSEAIRWFARARKSGDAKISLEAGRAYASLRPSLERFRTTTWLFPFYSTRWRDMFSYGQVKTEIKLGNLPFRPYFSTRFIGDTRRSIGGARQVALPQYLSESSFIAGVGVASRQWHGLMAWGEAGEAISYLHRPGTGRAIPDYRGGLSFARGWGQQMRSETGGRFFETNADGVFVSRFGNDSLAYSQNRLGYTSPPIARLGGLQTQIYLNGNVTVDVKRQPWANFVEAGPGVRFRWSWMPPSLVFSVNVMRGAYLLNAGNPRGPNFNDLRIGFWYAVTR